MDLQRPQFVFVTCQVGAEAAVKREVAANSPDWRFAFSRPGFLTFKLPVDCHLSDTFGLKSVFARAYGVSLGKVTGQSNAQLAAGVWRLAGERQFQSLHVWSRDLAAPGHRGFEPGIDEAAIAARQAIIAAAPPGTEIRFDNPTQRDDHVLDCIVVAPGEWWVGAHRATRRVRCWPGGLWPGETPEDLVSRAYLKMAEALDWSALPIKSGQRCVEIGCAPGGASQALLDRGLRVTGVDPAEVDPRVLQRPHFQHIRKRASDVRRKDFADFQWLIADINVAPAYTLDCVRDIVMHRAVRIRGLIMNLKLLDWKLAEDIPQYLAEVRSWGFRRIRVRQLSHSRQEICVAAAKPPSPTRRERGRPRKTSRRSDKSAS